MHLGLSLSVSVSLVWKCSGQMQEMAWLEGCYSGASGLLLRLMGHLLVAGGLVSVGV